MLRQIGVEDLVATLYRVLADQYHGKALFYWRGEPTEFRRVIGTGADIASRTEWLDVNELAADVLPRRARETLEAGLAARIEGAIRADRRVLVVENPYLLLRYLPAPFAPFWNLFVSSRRAVVVVLPAPVPRPVELPPYVRFRGDALDQLVAEAAEGAGIVNLAGGAEPW